MTDTPFTPGPWEVLKTELGIFIDSKRSRIASVYEWKNPFAANARLIAKAPELLQALEDVLYMYTINECSYCGCEVNYSNCNDHNCSIWKARNVIAEAKGEAIE